MNIFFRVDASTTIGTGHIMRCLTLANFLKENGAKVTFICADLKGNMIEHLKSKGFKVFTVADDLEVDAQCTISILKNIKVDLIIIDHYQIDIIWERTVRKAFPSIKIMVIDDLANREHDCDILLDQNYQDNFQFRYDQLVPKACKKLLGPGYLLLRPEFYKEEAARQSNLISSILIFYGGSDPTGETLKLVNALNQLEPSEIIIHVVVGLSNPQKDIIKETCIEKGYKYHEQIDYLADLMAECDLAFGAGGVTMWERCYLGLPSIVTIVAENQRESTIATAEYGAIWNLGWYEGVKQTDLVDIIKRAIKCPSKLKELSLRSSILMQKRQREHIHPVVKAIMEGKK
ncbi:UDP-2,4-diacetamido-2,4,6-trideoxy-beta-L-altropyranose hydrolase [Cytobacillus gottheilii]|uniref:UDP-2,4-diacetamido-2,4, 6-trideoxy-beta-L-altropyranose hydrolase n=1 Tax=Cytobacillus gottheilii TaxID=859144 RepID=UPI00082D2ABC|nr:UDP-2,4-diacetamido-2,4,6-trideoxy-beta-L-altropyranose hydrolase [Cytobacillus gottheilii]